ncbi:MAG: hypothetical protein AAF581_22425 [Planctomycetota bacterium]
MRHRIGWLSLLLMLGVAFSATSAQAQQSISLGNETILGLSSTTVDVSMTTTTGTEAFILAVGYDTAQVSVTNFDISALVAAAPAELISGSIFEPAGGATLGVVLDAFSPFNGQELAAGTDIVIAQLDVAADVTVAGPTVVPLTFVDGTFDSPPLDNILVQGGVSLGAAAITLNDGSVTLDAVVVGNDEFAIGDTSISQAAPVGCVEVTMTNSGAAEGFVLSIEHDSALTLEEINVIGTVTEANGAELVVPELFNAQNGGTLGVVMDFNSPFTGQTIPAGADQHVANFCYSCDNPPVQPAPATTHALTFVDGVFSSPPLDNMIVIAGLSVTPTTSGGTVTCEAIPDAGNNTVFSCGVLDGSNIVDPVAAPGETFTLSFFWTDPINAIGGFSVAVCFDCNLEFQPNSFTVDGTIVGTVGAEFVQSSVGTTPNAMGFCEMTGGILLDALPPFDQQTVPPTTTPLEMARVDVTVNPNTPCNQCLDVFFCDGATGSGVVPIQNVVVVNSTQSLQGFPTLPCQVCVEAPRIFIRSDCNGDGLQNIADASTVIVTSFLGFQAPCLDACDSNDDGMVNLADAVYILNYMFKFGPPPPPPFDDNGDFIFDPGVDPTADVPVDLGCVDGLDPCP